MIKAKRVRTVMVVMDMMIRRAATTTVTATVTVTKT